MQKKTQRVQLEEWGQKEMVGWVEKLKGWWWWVGIPDLAAEHSGMGTIQARKDKQWSVLADDTPGLLQSGQGCLLSLPQGLRHSQLP